MKRTAFLVAACVTAASLYVGGELAQIPLSQIKANVVALRAVDKETEEYKGLVASIRAQGVLSAISVRRKKDNETGLEFYEIIDGLHRFMASCDARQSNAGEAITSIPAQILTLDDAAVLEAQIIGNIHTVETKPIEYNNQLLRILKQNPMMTEAQLSVKLGKSPSWVSDRLKLTKLTQVASTLVNEGHITLSNGYALSKLPSEEQANWIDRAQTLPPDQFTAAVVERKKELDKLRRSGQAATEESFIATPHFRKIADIRAEAEHLATLTNLINKYASGDPLKAAQLALLWTLQLDPDTVGQREADYNADKKRREEASAAKQLERKAARAKEASERAAKVQAEVDALKAKSGAAVATA